MRGNLRKRYMARARRAVIVCRRGTRRARNCSYFPSLSCLVHHDIIMVSRTSYHMYKGGETNLLTLYHTTAVLASCRIRGACNNPEREDCVRRGDDVWWLRQCDKADFEQNGR